MPLFGCYSEIYVTRYEKGLLFLVLLLFGLQVAGVTTKDTLFILSVGILAASYFFGGKWLFESRGRFHIWLCVMAGVCFAAALVSFTNTAALNRTSFFQVKLIPNGILCAGLGIYLFRHRKKPDVVPVMWLLWLRSALLLIISVGFAYAPISFTPYRKVLLALNRGNEGRESNLMMHDFALMAFEALEKGECVSAISLSHQAYRAGNRWLDSDSVRRKGEMSGAYNTLYEAYECQGQMLLAQHKIAEALLAYKQGDAFLAAADNRQGGTVPLPYWETEKAWSLKNIAVCYQKLGQYNESDSLFLAAIRAYRKVHPKPDIYYARLVIDLAGSFAAGDKPGASTQMLTIVNRFLSKDTTSKAGNMRVANEIQISLNHMQLDSLPQALHRLQTLVYPRRDTTENRYLAGIHQSICLYKMGQYTAAGQALQPPLRYYKQQAQGQWPSLALCEILLAKTSTELADYPQAQRYADDAKALVLQHNGAGSPVYPPCLVALGALNTAVGKYTAADQDFMQALAICQKEARSNEHNSLDVLTQLADLDVTLGRVEEAQAHIDAALSLLTKDGPIELPSQTGELITAAYVDYVRGHMPAAARKYRQVLAIEARYGQQKGVTAAAAWNGLGLVESEQRRFVRADSVFQQAILLHEKLFTERHPLTANVYLNYGLLRLRQGQQAEAEALFQKALGIAQSFLPADHDMFGDLAMAMGELAAEKKQVAQAHGYYQQALAIYSHKFPATHWKVKRARQKAGH